jgi:alpha-glucosidase
MQWTGEDAKVGFTTGTPWRAPADDYPETNVAAQTVDPDSLLSLYRDLIHLRNGYAALRTGETTVVEADTQRLYALLRYDDEAAFLVLVNVHPRPLTPELYSLTLESGPFAGPVTATTVLAVGQGAVAQPAAPEINASGGFSGYAPFEEIPAGTAVILRLAP